MSDETTTEAIDVETTDQEATTDELRAQLGPIAVGFKVAGSAIDLGERGTAMLVLFNFAAPEVDEPLRVAVLVDENGAKRLRDSVVKAVADAETLKRGREREMRRQARETQGNQGCKRVLAIPARPPVG